MLERHFSVWLCLVWLSAAWFAVPSAAGVLTPEEQEARAFIDPFPMLRLWSPEAPGSGHQSSTINVLHRLRRLGYKGAIELIYERANAEKLEALLPGFQGGGAAVQRLKGSITAIRKDHWGSGKNTERVGLGLTGGDDDGFASDFINADFFLRLNPRNWAESYSLTFPVNDRGARSTVRMPALKHMYLQQQLPHPKDPKTFIEKAMAGPGFTEKTERVQLLHKIAAHPQGFEFVPAYGLSRPKDELRFGNYLEALQTTFARTPELYRPAGAVVAVITDFSEEKRFALRKKVLQLNQGSLSKVQLVGDSAESLSRFLHKPPSFPAIGVVLLGRVPRDVFDYLFLQATLPAIAEGRQTANLMHTAAKPYFDTYGHDEFDEAVPGSGLLDRASQGLRNYLYPSNGVPPIVEALEESRQPTSAIHGYFAEMRTRATSLKYDMVVHGLRAAAKVAKALPDGHAVADQPAFKNTNHDCFLRFLDLQLPRLAIVGD